MPRRRINLELAEDDRDHQHESDSVDPVSMAEIIGPSALTCGVMSEKRLAIFAVSTLGFVAAVLVGFWLVLGLAD